MRLCLSGFFGLAILVSGPCAVVHAQTAPPVSPLAENYGFLPVEVTKVNARARSLLSGDFNDDGRTDLVLVNNANHRLDLLLQRKALPSVVADVAAVRKNANDIDSHPRFELRKLSVEAEVVSLATGDLNHDGRMDLVYFCGTEKLVIRYQQDDGLFSPGKEQRIPDVAAGQWCLATGDLNHDDRADLVVLGTSETFVLLQSQTGELATPLRLLNTSEQLALIQVADLNDDGKDDLCYLAGDAANKSLGIRLQTDFGQVGPEYLFPLERPRSVSIRDVDGDGSAEILVIDSRTGRLKVLKFEKNQPASAELPDRLVRYGFGKRGSGRDRSLSLADIDANGLLDAVVSDPEASRLLLFQQTMERGLDLGTPFPSLVGSSQVAAIRGEAGRAGRVMVLSPAEKLVGEAVWQNQRLLFPQPLSITDEPVALGIGDVSGDSAPEVLVVTRAKEKKTGEYSIAAYRQSGDAKGWSEDLDFSPQPLSLPQLKGSPERLMLVDVAGDAQAELVIFNGSKSPVVLQRTTEKGNWTEVATSGALGAGTIAAGATFPGQLSDRPGLLVAQGNFVRQLRLSPGNRWEVIDQVNAGETNARLVGTAQLDLDGQPGLELVMVDDGVKRLRLLKQEGGRFQPWMELEMSSFDFRGAEVADLNGDQRNDLVLFGSDQLGVLYAQSPAPKLTELATYETALERSFPTDILVGDVNGDGYLNLVMTDTRGHTVEILEFRPPNSPERAMYFTIFEEKGFAREEGSGIDPREGLIADVTGDQLADLVLLVHDRILVYPQDSGAASRE